MTLKSRFFGLSGFLCLLLASLSVRAAPPTAVITRLPSVASRMAPHVLHVDATASKPGSGTLATCTFKWTFTGGAIAGGTMNYADARPGKAAITYNGYTDQRGFNAACLCRSAGTVTTTLTVTNELGESATATLDTTIVAPAHRTVYLDTSLAGGANNGGSPLNAFRSLEGPRGAVAYMQSRGAAPIHLSIKRGTILSNTVINAMTGNGAQNTWIDAYGTGANPIVADSQTTKGASSWDIQRDAENVLIENIDFRGDPSRVVNSFRFRSSATRALKNVAIIGCNFQSVSQATNTIEMGEARLTGYLQMNCTVDDHLRYGYYGVYDSAVFLGNIATNSAQQLESSVRLAGNKLNIDCLYSKFIHPTSNKDALRIMPPDPTHGSEYVWITRGHFLGPVEICWNSDASHPATGRFQVLENCLLVPNDSAASNTWLNVGGSAGASYEDVTIRNCVFHYAASTGKVNPPIATGCQQPSTRLTVTDNTIVIVGPAGAADLLYADANCDNFRLERNIFFSSSDGKAYFFKPQANITAGNNVWYTSGAVVNVAGEGKLPLAKWNDRAGTANDYSQSGMTAATFAAPWFVPPDAMAIINGPYSAPAGAALDDYNGKPRTGRAGAADASDSAVREKAN